MTTPAFHFQGLHPDFIIDALLMQHIRVASGLTPLNSYENRVYQFLDEDKRRLVVKFYRPQRWSAVQIQEEHQFAVELQQQHVPLAAPLLINGSTLLHYQGYYFAVWLSQGARQYEPDNMQQLEEVGRCLGRLHQVGRKQLFVERPAISAPAYLQPARQVFAASDVIPAKLKTHFLQACDKLISDVLARWQDNFQPLRLHGDCHAGNILWRDGPLLVDLDDAHNGPAVQDLWMLLHGDTAQQRLQLSILIDAYGEFCSFNLPEITLIESLRAMRLVYYLAWLLRRWPDPAFPRNFPWLNDEDYWQRQIATLITQRQALREPPLQLTPVF